MSAESPRIRTNDPRDKKDAFAPKSPAAEWNEMRAKGEIPPDPERTEIEKYKRNPFRDPVVKDVADRIKRLSKNTSNPEEQEVIQRQQWGAFVKTHPEKAAAYKDILHPIGSQIEIKKAKQTEIAEKLHADVSEVLPSEDLSNQENRALEEVKARLAGNSETGPADILSKESESEAAPVSNENESVDLAEESTESHEDVEGPEEEVENKAINIKKKQEKKPHSNNEKASVHEKEKRKWSEKTTKEKILTVGKWGAGAGGVVALTGLGVAANASVLGAFGVAPAATGIGLSMAGIGAGVTFIGGMALLDTFYLNLIKNLWTEGSAWFKKISGGLLSGGGGGGKKPAAKAGGGGDHGGGHH